VQADESRAAEDAKGDVFEAKVIHSPPEDNPPPMRLNFPLGDAAHARLVEMSELVAPLRPMCRVEEQTHISHLAGPCAGLSG
jgi:hypothetical protein